MTYTFRKSAFTRTETFVIEDSAIKIYNENKILIDTIRLDDIVSISLVHTPTRVARKMHQCSIKTRSKKSIVLRNYSYLGLANFKNQNDDYLALINELHEKTKGKNIQFKKGINKAGFLLMMLFMILMTGLMIVIVIVLFNKQKYVEMGISSLAVLLFLFLIITSVVRYKPENYNPHNIPKQLLPN